MAAQGHALDAGGRAAHGPDVRAGKPDGKAVRRGEHHMLVIADGPHHHQLVVLAQAHGQKPAAAAARIQRRRGTLDHAAPGHKEKILVLGELAQGQDGRHPLALLQRQEVVDVDALGRAAPFRHLVHLELMHAPLVGEQAQVLMVGRDEEFLDVVVLRGVDSGDALAAAPLLLIVLQIGALHVAPARQRDDHFLIGDEVFKLDAAQGFAQDLRAPGGGEGVGDLADLPLHLAAQYVGIFQHGLEKLYLFEQFLIFGQQFLALQPREPLETHVQDGARLDFAQAEGGHEAGPGLLGRGRSADERHHLVDVVDGDPQSLKDMRPRLGLFQIKARPADDHFAAVVHKTGEGALEIEQNGPVVGHGQHVDSEARLQRGELVERVDDDIGNGAALEINDDADAPAVGFVTQVRNAVQLAVIDQGRDLLHQRGLVESEGDLGDDHGLKALFPFLDDGPAAHLHRAPARAVGISQTLAGIDRAGGGKVRPAHDLHEIVHRALRLFQQQEQGFAEFAQIVRRNIGRHAHGDARGAVEQQIRHPGGQYRGFLERIVVIGPEIDGILVQIIEKFLGKARHAHFGVAHGRRRVAVDGAEVALPVHQGVAHGKILGHAYQGIVHGGIAMRMILADDVTHDAGGLLVRPVIAVGKLVLGIHDAPVHGLQPVARVGNGAADDDRKGILQIGLAQFLFDIDARMLFGRILFAVCHAALAGKRTLDGETAVRRRCRSVRPHT